MSLKSNRCSKQIYKEPPLYRKKEFKSSVIKIIDSSRSSLPANSICFDLASEDDFHLTKRRKMNEEYNSLLANGNTMETTTRILAGSGCNSTPEQKDIGKYSTAYINYRPKSTCQHSSFDASAAKPVMELISSRSLCISILGSDILLTKESELSQKMAPKDNESNPLFQCTGCGSMEDPSKMLICDCCEGAFHLSCCKPRIRNIPLEKWYCKVCSRKKPKRQRGKLSPKHNLPRPNQRPRRGRGTIQDMLVDAEPHETEVRIGMDFQADVPEWSGPIPRNKDQFVEPSELDPSETMTMGVCFIDPKLP